jgi:hypothetical protein
MGLTERHWFENEDVPENYEWDLEDAVYNSCTNKKADTVEVVRCNDCKYCGSEISNGIKFAKCELKHNWMPQPNWFCADGERKEGR